MNATDPDLFAWSRPAPAAPAPATPRRGCPFVISGFTTGGTGDLPTLVIDATGDTTIESSIP